MTSRRFPPPWSVDHSPSKSRCVCSMRVRAGTSETTARE